LIIAGGGLVSGILFIEWGEDCLLSCPFRAPYTFSPARCWLYIYIYLYVYIVPRSCLARPGAFFDKSLFKIREGVLNIRAREGAVEELM